MTYSVRQRRVLRAWLLLITVLVVVTSCLIQCRVSSYEVIRIGYMKVSTGLPLFVALEKGYYTSQGVEVEATPFESVNQAMDALLSGRLDAVEGVGFTTFLAVTQNAPGKFKMYWTCAESESVFSCSILKTSGDLSTGPQDLRGKRIGTYTGTSQVINLKAILGELGLDPAIDVKIEQVAKHILLQAFASKQFDFLFSIEPDITIALQQKMGERFIDNPRVKYIVNPFVAGGAVVSTDFASSRTYGLRAMLAASDSAISFIRKNSREAKATLTKYTSIERDLALESGLYEFWKLGEENMEAMQSLADIYLASGLLEKKIVVSNMMLISE